MPLAGIRTTLQKADPLVLGLPALARKPLGRAESDGFGWNEPVSWSAGEPVRLWTVAQRFPR